LYNKNVKGIGCIVENMSLMVLAIIGLNILQVQGSKRINKVLNYLLNCPQYSSTTQKKLIILGEKVGLSPIEIQPIIQERQQNTKRFPSKWWHWIIMCILALIAIVGVRVLVWNALYVPGTDYGTITPQDFKRRIIV
jgi:hypothetical protein